VYGDVLEFEVRDSANFSTLTRSISGGTVLTPGEWYHVAGVYSETGYIRTYVDGNLDKEMSTSAILGPSSGNLIFGREPFSTSNYFHGDLDDVRVYDYALTHGQILTVPGLGTQYIPVTSPANIYDLEAINNKKVNFKDYSVLLDSWGATEEWPSW